MTTSEKAARITPAAPAREGAFQRWNPKEERRLVELIKAAPTVVAAMQRQLGSGQYRPFADRNCMRTQVAIAMLAATAISGCGSSSTASFAGKYNNVVGKYMPDICEAYDVSQDAIDEDDDRTRIRSFKEFATIDENLLSDLEDLNPPAAYADAYAEMLQHSDDAVDTLHDVVDALEQDDSAAYDAATTEYDQAAFEREEAEEELNDIANEAIGDRPFDTPDTDEC